MTKAHDLWLEGLGVSWFKSHDTAAAVASGAGNGTRDGGEHPDSQRSLASDPLENPGQTGTEGQDAAVLEPKPESANEPLGTGAQSSQVLTQPVLDKAEKALKGGYSWLTKEGETKIIIENRTSHVMSFVPGTEVLDKPDDAAWRRKAPPEIAAGGRDHMLIKTDMKVRGVTRANTSGSVAYEIADGKDKDGVSKVRLAWTRKGDKGMAMKDDWQTDTTRFKVLSQQTADGEFTFFVSETKAADNKKKDSPGGDDAKDKVPPPAGIFVSFDVGKSVLKSEAKSKLHDYAVAYLESKSTAPIHCEGYASIEGQDAANTNLSYERAEAVFAYLTDPKTGNLPGNKVSFHGSGPTKHFDPKNFPPNRRVTVGAPAAKVPAEKAPDTKQAPKSPAEPMQKVRQERDKEEPPMRPAVRGAAGGSGA